MTFLQSLEADFEQLEKFETAFAANGSESFRFGNEVFTIANTGTGPVHFTTETALAAIAEYAIAKSANIVIGSTSITVTPFTS